jgi:DNA-binding NtrC family response regulator
MSQPETLLKRRTEILTLPAVKSTGSTVMCEALDLAGTFAEAKARAVERFEVAYLEALMRRCGWNLTKASRQARVVRSHLRTLLKRRGLYDSGGAVLHTAS